MTAQRLDGAEVARAIKAELKGEVEELGRQGVRPGLGVLLAGDDPASAVYVRSKTRACDELGLHHETARLSESTTTEEVVAVVEGYNRRSDIHGILVQLPLPPRWRAGACWTSWTRERTWTASTRRTSAASSRSVRDSCPARPRGSWSSSPGTRWR